jgi:WD40 repeat protein
VAISPDGKWLISGSADRTIRLWEVATGELLRTLTGHEEGVQAVDFHPDGGLLASGGVDGTVLLWEGSAGKVLRVFTGHKKGVNAVAFHPDGKVLASAGSDGTMRLWELETGEELHVLTGHEGSVATVAFHPEGKLLASGGADGSVRVWEAETGKQHVSFADHHGEAVRAVVFSPDGKILASGGDDGQIQFRDVRTGEKLRSSYGHFEEVSSLAFSPDGKTLAAGSGSRRVRLWEVVTGKEIRLFTQHTQKVSAVAFAPDGKWLATGGTDKTIGIEPLVSGLALGLLKRPPERRLEHAADCPDRCAPCQTALKKALDHLASQEGEGFGATGLALLASGSTVHEGPYQGRLKQSLDYFKTLGAPTSRDLNGHGHGIPMGMITLFLSEMLLRDPSDKELGTLLEAYVEEIGRAPAHVPQYGGIRRGSCVGTSTAFCLVGMYAARRAEMAVPEEWIQRHLKYLQTSQDIRGMVPYDLSHCQVGHVSDLARTYLAWFAADRFGWKETRLWEGARAWLKDSAQADVVRSEATKARHTADLLAGCMSWGVYQVEGYAGWYRLWKGAWRDCFHRAQQEDGSMALLREWSYIDGGPVAPTAWLSLIALTPRETLLVTQRKGVVEPIPFPEDPARAEPVVYVTFDKDRLFPEMEGRKLPPLARDQARTNFVFLVRRTRSLALKEGYGIVILLVPPEDADFWALQWGKIPTHGLLPPVAVKGLPEGYGAYLLFTHGMVPGKELQSRLEGLKMKELSLDITERLYED